MLTYETWDAAPSIDFREDDETKGALSVLRWAYDYYGDDVVYACSFGVEGMILLHLIDQVKPDAKVVFLDTDLHFKETYELIERVKERFPRLQIVLQKPELTLEEQAAEHGAELWKSNPNACCNIRKIVPLEKALAQGKAWISGLRREQSPTRQNVQFLNHDHRFHSIKVCPLIHWTWKEVWRYVYKHDLPYNPLHDIGYPSIGCEVCTRPSEGGSSDRSGRWSGTGKTECGLHQ